MVVVGRRLCLGRGFELFVGVFVSLFVLALEVMAMRNTQQKVRLRVIDLCVSLDQIFDVDQHRTEGKTSHSFAGLLVCSALLV